MEAVPDPRAEKEDICGVTWIGGTGIEWICINPVHDKVYKTKRGEYTPSTSPKVHQHYMVPRYPMRVKFEEENPNV